MGWMPALGHCTVCGLDLHNQTVYWSPTADGVTCYDDRRPNSRALSAASVAESPPHLPHPARRLTPRTLAPHPLRRPPRLRHRHPGTPPRTPPPQRDGLVLALSS